MLNDLLLLSGNDIPFIEAQVNIHQPSIKEIAYIGEESFFIGCEILNFTKESLSMEDRQQLQQFSDLEVLLSILQGNLTQTKKEKTCATLILTLMFPDYQIHFGEREIQLTKGNVDDLDVEIKVINSKNFNSFQKILSQMFNLKPMKPEETYNPGGDMARKIAQKFEERKRKLAEQSKSSEGKINILCRYVSILSVGQQKDMNDLLNYTVYQLFDEFQRFELKMQADFNFQARMAGAKDLPEIEDWMKDIHA